MPKATQAGGKLSQIENCYVDIPGFGKITANMLPDLGDGKQAEYNDEPIMGRATPMKTYSHSSGRSISLTLHFITTKKADINQNLKSLRALQSLVYPRDGDANVPFYPPPVCRLKCGKLLGDNELCVVLRSYSVKYATDVVWDEETLLPYKFDVDTQWDAVYKSTNLPGQERIVSMGN